MIDPDTTAGWARRLANHLDAIAERDDLDAHSSIRMQAVSGGGRITIDYDRALSEIECAKEVLALTSETGNEDIEVSSKLAEVRIYLEYGVMA